MSRSLYISRILDKILDYIRSKRNYHKSLISLQFSFSKNTTNIWRNLLNCLIKFVGLLRRPEFYRQIVSVKNWIKELRTNFWQHWSGPSGMSHSTDYGHMSRVSNIESDNSQNVGLEDYNNIFDRIFSYFTTPSIKITLTYIG